MPLGSKCNQLGRRPRGGRDRDAGMCPSGRGHRGWPAAPTACHRFALGVFWKNHLCPHHGFGHPGSGAGREQTSVVLNEPRSLGVICHGCPRARKKHVQDPQQLLAHGTVWPCPCSQQPDFHGRASKDGCHAVAWCPPRQ